LDAPRFVSWTPQHLGALAATAAASYALVRAAAATGRLRRILPALLALALLLGQAAEPLLRLREGRLDWTTGLPLDLCDASAFLTAAALLRRRRGILEVAWYWGMGGAPAALLTPDLAHGAPSAEYFRFFLVHGGIVASLAYLVASGLRPRPGSWRPVLGWTLLYAGLVGGVDALLGANYMYLRAKPGSGSLLDLFGPWPWYVAGGAAVGALLFRLLALPFRNAPE